MINIDRSFNSYGSLDSRLLAWSEKFSIETGKNINILPYCLLPNPELNSSDTIATFRLTSKEINIFLNEKYLPTLIKSGITLNGILVHEMLHYEMNYQGFPVTCRKAPIHPSGYLPYLGTLIQCSVLHIELERRQRERNLPMMGLENQQIKLLRELKMKPAYLELVGILSNEQIGVIQEIFRSLDTILNPVIATQGIAQIISCLNLDTILIVCKPSI